MNWLAPLPTVALLTACSLLGAAGGSISSNDEGLTLPPGLPPGLTLLSKFTELAMPSELPPEVIRMAPGLSLPPGRLPPSLPPRLMSIIRLQKTRYTIFENGNAFRVCAGLMRRSPGPLWVSANIATRDITATAGKDYKLFSRSVIFRPGKKESCVNVKIVDDNEVELDREEFEIVLSINSPFVQVDPKANTAVITIVDNDKAIKPVKPNVIGLQQRQYTISEARGTLRVCAKLLRRCRGQIRGNVTIHDITATAGEDYKVLSSRDLQFRPGRKQSCVTIRIIEDAKAEPDSEMFEITLHSITPLVTVDPKARKAVVTIVDNNHGSLNHDSKNVLRLEKTHYTVGEAGALLRVCVDLTRKHRGPVRGSLDIHDITATADEDYKLPSSKILLFRPDEQRSCVTIKILDDKKVESENEKFEIKLNPSAPLVEADPKARYAVVTIVDNDD